ncbi:MAG: 1-acyl-sn-glycerol-3-phosphate acyltransferase [Proteobacteria bacterium]|nr:1-acyl-sn-glycerol-3-phosphate acyltransferase [Pseudomonadota bacterium]
MKNLIKILFIYFITRPIILIMLGLNVVGRKNMPTKGPAVVLANHNSHLDTLVLLSLFPLSVINKVRPVAAVDYFFKNKLIAWFSVYCLGIIPLDRQGGTNKEHIFNDCYTALDNNEILIIFPEGSRGHPEKLSRLKKGVFYLLKDKQNIPIFPVVMHGLGKSLPKGEVLLVPFNCDVVIGEPLEKYENAQSFVKGLVDTFDKLFKLCLTKATSGC